MSPTPDKDILIQGMLSELQLKPKPDSKEWWQEVAQGLGIKLFETNNKIENLEKELKEREKIIEIYERQLTKIQGKS